MERATYLRLIQLIAGQIAACEKDIAALAREALSPSTTGARRAEALILRAERQTRSVLLLRDLQRLKSNFNTAPYIDLDAERRNSTLEPPRKQPRSEVIQEAMRLHSRRSANL